MRGEWPLMASGRSEAGDGATTQHGCDTGTYAGKVEAWMARSGTLGKALARASPAVLTV